MCPPHPLSQECHTCFLTQNAEFVCMLMYMCVHSELVCGYSQRSRQSCYGGGQNVCHFEVMLWNHHGRHISGAPPGDLYSHIWERCNTCWASSNYAWITMVNFDIPGGMHDTCSSHTDYRGDPSLSHACVMYAAAVRQCQYTHLGNCILLLLPAPCREDWW